MGSLFLELVPVAEAAARLERFTPIERRESVALAAAAGRVVARTLTAPEALPPFDRSLMDGYAVRSADAAAARETAPVFLAVTGEVEMGRSAAGTLGPGQAMAVPTGGMLPAGADAVVMIEHTRELPDGRIEVLKSVAGGQHVLPAGDDITAGATLLAAGHRVAALDLGALAACGVCSLEVFERPRVAILSTGDELVAPEERPGPGQVRDTNAVTLAAQVEHAGGRARLADRVVDDYAALLAATEAARREADLVLLSGGSSVGARDHTARVLRELSGGGLLLEGIAISPGKPTLAAAVDGVPVIGMPGHPVSSFVVFQVIIAPLLRRRGGELQPPPRPRVRGRLTANAPAAPGRETWLRVRLQPNAGGPPAVVPVPGSSAVYASLLGSDGLLRIPAEREGFARDEEVEVEVLR
jgi:molybdopterin molybdotransferase